LIQNSIPQDKEYPKLSKATSGYVEIKQFENADLNAGYFCNDCIYFIKDNQCAIVKNDGPDVNGDISGKIAPHGLCTLWLPIEGQTR
jgi:hypothetical protein